MDFNIEIRRKQLENLDQFMGSSRDRVDSILEYLGWSAQKITENQKEMVKCMVNPSSHRIPAAAAVTHIQNCAWRKENYAADDLPLSEPKPVPGSTIVIDDMTKINVLNGALAKNPLMKTGWRSHEPVPKTSNRLLATFTPDERLALYEYSVAATRGPPEVPEFNMTKPKIEERHNLTPDELKAIHRDARRRRIKYKSKCVHTNRKSTTEVLRDVIESQMEQYEDYLRDEQDGGSIAGQTEYSDRSYSKERRDDRDVSRERREDYDDRRCNSKEKREDYDRRYSGEQRDEYEREFSKERRDYNDKSSSKRDDDDKGYSKRDNYDDKGYSKTENCEEKRDDKSVSKKEHEYESSRSFSKDRKEQKVEANVEPAAREQHTKDTSKASVDNNVNKEHTMKVHTKGYLKEYSTELRNNFSQQEQSKEMLSNKKHQSLIEAELEHESTETASPRSSRSQNSYRSQESRHRGRPRTPTEPDDRSRSRERRHSSRYDNEHRHQRSRRYDDREFDRKYRDRRHRYDRHRSDR